MIPFTPNWKPDCGGNIDSYTPVLQICLFTSPDGSAGAWLYLNETVLLNESSQENSQPEAQVWCQNKAHEWTGRIEQALANQGLERK